MAELLSIGNFSRASLLTVKALRNYHEMGLLVPAHVDTETGYRNYDVGQLADAVVIRKLRNLDVSMADITSVVEARDPDVTARVLARHLASMEDRLTALTATVGDLLAGTERPTSLTPPHVTEVESSLVAVLRGHVEREAYASFLDRSFGVLFEEILGAGVEPAGPSGACYPPEATDREEVHAFVPIARGFEPSKASGVTVEELPSSTVVQVAHHGSYDDIGDAYMALGRWVALEAESLGEPVREHYVVSYEVTDDPSSFVTEIQWPIRPRS